VEAEKSRLAEEFPNSFVFPSEIPPDITPDQIAEYHDLYRELQDRLAYVRRKQEEIERNASFIAKERKELQREKARIEKEKVIAAAELEDIRVIQLKEKYRSLKRVCAEEKRQWELERQSLLAQIPREIPPPEIAPIVKPVKSQKAAPKQKTIPDLNGYAPNFDFDPGPIKKQELKSEGRKLIRYTSGLTATEFKNGTKKMKLGQACYTFYENGDVAIEFEDGARAYRYLDTKTVEMILPDHTAIYSFPNGQTEKHFVDGDKEIHYTNGQLKLIHPNGDYEVRHPSGKIERCVNGHLIISFEGLKDV
jgi:hypothetical protein